MEGKEPSGYDLKVLNAAARVYEAAREAGALTGLDAEFYRGVAAGALTMHAFSAHGGFEGMPETETAAAISTGAGEARAEMERMIARAAFDEMMGDPVAAMEELMRELEDE